MAQPPKAVRTIVREGIVGLKDQIEDGFRNLKADLDIQLEQDRRSGRDPRDLAAQVTHLEEELQQCRDEKRKERNRADPVSEAQIQSLQEQIQKLKDRAKNKGNWTSNSAPNVRLLQAKNASLEDQVRRLQDQLHNAGNADTVRVRQLEADKSHLELETQRLTAEVDALRASSSSTPAAENQKLEELIRRLQRELRRLKDASKNQAAGVLRRIMEEEQNLPLDSVLARDYFNLVGETLKIQRKYYPADSNVRPVIAADATEFQKECFGQWTMGLTERQLNYRTRQVIFTLVCDAIINSFCFDTDDTPQGGMERLLALLEAEFTKVKGHDNDIAIWRLRTFICLEWLYPKTTRRAINSRVAKIAVDIEGFMAPILRKDIYEDGKQALQRDLGKMCQSAHDLPLNLRNSPYKYEVVVPDPGTNFVEEEHHGLDVEWNENPDQDVGLQFPGKPIAFAISGTLVEHAEQGRVVLEKADIIMKAF